MTIDERLDKLVERHEALTQSVELLLATAKQHAEQMDSLREVALALVTVAEAHENRLARLESGT
jgi:hypothetical protein